MPTLKELWDTFFFFLIVIDPLAVLPTFIVLTRGEAALAQRMLALRASAIAFFLLFGFAFLGEWVLMIFGISTPALQISGGILLLLAAVNMVIAKQPNEGPHGEEARCDVSVFPLAIPLIAGPGALTAVVMKMRVATTWAHQGGLLFVLAAALVVTALCLLNAARLTRVLGMTGTNVLTRVFGIILAALAVQFMLNGLQEVFGSTRG